MKMKFLVAASLSAVPACAFQDTDKSDRCKPMDIMMGVHKGDPKPEALPNGPPLPKAQSESTGPAVLIPNCRGEETKRREKNDYPLA